CKEVVKRDNFSLLDFPILKCWPQDGGRFITLPCVITRDSRTGKRNVGMYRMQVFDDRTTGMHWQRQKVAAEHYRDALRLRASGRAEVPITELELSKEYRTAAVDMMARSSGGSRLAEGLTATERPSGRMEVAVAIGTDP